MDYKAPSGDAVIENRTVDEISIGDSASVVRSLTEQDLALFAVVSGDVNPAHLDPAYAEADLFHKVIANGMWLGGLISAALGTSLPGPGAIYLAQDLQFRAPVMIGDTIATTVIALEKQPERKQVVFDCRCINQRGRQVATGRAVVRAPTEKIRRPRAELPEVRSNCHRRFRKLLARAQACRRQRWRSRIPVMPPPSGQVSIWPPPG
ncbi:MAG: MaoC/PaaZ C-terminal domain-containing protein [Acetobacteraceae bacterium]